MVEYLEQYATRLNLTAHIDFDSRVAEITKADGLFTLRIGGARPRTLHSTVILMATGCVSEYAPDIPGLDLLPSYATHDLDKRKYRRKKVLVIGMGNSAFEVRCMLPSTLPLASCVFFFSARRP
jgi:cation diffusion facilitator CzcD-associated flavoprotein CzcO